MQGMVILLVFKQVFILPKALPTVLRLLWHCHAAHVMCLAAVLMTLVPTLIKVAIQTLGQAGTQWINCTALFFRNCLHLSQEGNLFGIYQWNPYYAQCGSQSTGKHDVELPVKVPLVVPRSQLPRSEIFPTAAAIQCW